MLLAAKIAVNQERVESLRLSSDAGHTRAKVQLP
jgi:hypothetical protein